MAAEAAAAAAAVTAPPPPPPLLTLPMRRRRRRQVADDFEALRLKLDPSAVALPEEPEPAPTPAIGDRGSLSRFTSILNRLEVRAARARPPARGRAPAQGVRPACARAHAERRVTAPIAARATARGPRR